MSEKTSTTMPVVLLAGGVAQRLGAIAESTPKCLVKVAGCPFIEHQLRLLAKDGVKEVLLCVSHLGEQIEEFVKDGSRFDLKVSYSFDGPVRLGTGGALKKAQPLLWEYFGVLYADTYLDISYKDVFQSFQKQGKKGMMTVLANEDRWDKSNVLFDNGKIITYNKRNPSPDMQHIDYGFSVLAKSCLDTYPDHTGFDLEEIFESLIDSDQLAGFEVSQRFYEIGTPESLAQTEEYLQSQVIKGAKVKGKTR